jgi:hypothetical protein
MAESILQATDDELRRRHAHLYRKLMPTIEQYSKMASEAVALQKEMYHRWINQLDPMPETRALNLVCSFSVKETPATVQGILQGIQDRGIQIELAIYDDRPERMEFCLYGLAPQVPAQPEKQEVANG